MTPTIALLCALLFIFIQPCCGCGLGHIITSISVNANGEYQVNCSFRAYPICPESCFWTEKTCEEYAKDHHWNRQKQLMANMTYSYPRQHQLKNNTTTTVSSTSAPASISKRVQRKCCNSTTLTATKCQTVEWQASPSNTKFDVGAYAKKNLHCQKDDAIIRDAKLKNGKQNELILDICCLEYNAEDNKTIVCFSPGRAGKGGLGVVGVGAAIALPLALGIGIPLLVEEEEEIHCHQKYDIVENEFPLCQKPLVGYRDVLTLGECCLLCEKNPGSACEWNPERFFCFACISGFSKKVSKVGRTAFYPK